MVEVVVGHAVVVRGHLQKKERGSATLERAWQFSAVQFGRSAGSEQWLWSRSGKEDVAAGGICFVADSPILRDVQCQGNVGQAASVCSCAGVRAL